MREVPRTVIAFLVWLPLVTSDSRELLKGSFPDDFMWGVATSSYQIEGGWDADGKGLNIWDTFCHGHHFCSGDNGNVACSSYTLWQRDIEMAEELGVHFYRFSLSWARILPDGTTDTINQPGIDYYNNLIDGLLAAGLQPMITLYHWDLPQALQDQGGWENEDMVQYFREYARLCFETFGDRVRWWITINEPWVVSWEGYGAGILAPGIIKPATGVYDVAHILIKAHAEAWHLYDEEYRQEQGGHISTTLNIEWKEPLNSSNALDVAAAERAMQFNLGWFAHPIFINGDYPEVMKTQVAAKSKAQGYSKSRLPEFTEEEKQHIAGTHDFLGINHYSTSFIEHREQSVYIPSYVTDQDVSKSSDPDWPRTGSIQNKVVPWGLRKLLRWIKAEYDNPSVLITENGMSDRNGTLQDQHRVNFYRDYINNVLQAVELDGCDVRAFTAWSLMDNFEWAMGYHEKFGLFHVDFSDENRTRSPKASASYYQSIIRNNGFVEK